MSEATAKQQTPSECAQSQKVEPALIAMIRERTAEGVKKYGTPLQTHNGRDALIDVLQEALDLCQYMMQDRLELMDRVRRETLSEIAEDAHDICTRKMHWYSSDRPDLREPMPGSGTLAGWLRGYFLRRADGIDKAAALRDAMLSGTNHSNQKNRGGR